MKRALVLSALALLGALTLFVPASASADVVFCAVEGEAAGQCKGQTGLDVDRETGEVYVADRGNNRIDVFDQGGAFLRTFGWDVVKSGPDKVAAPSEQQSITLGANTTGGTFTLSFNGQSSAPIAFNAPAAGVGSVEAALNAIPTISGPGGSVSVTGAAGGPYAVTFGGSFAEDGVPQLGSNANGLTVSSGSKSATVATTVQGGAFEICKPASGDTCKAGSQGSGLGQLSLGSPGPDSVAVDNDPASTAYHDVYVYDGANRRVQRFHPGGEFVLSFGTAGFGAGQFDREDNPLALGPGGVVYVGGQNANNAAGQSRVQEFEPTGAFVKQILLKRDKCDASETETGPVASFGRVLGLGVDSAGAFYVFSLQFDVGPDGVRKYDSAGSQLLNPCEPIDRSSNVNAIALDAAGNLFVADNTSFNAGGGSETAVYEFSSAGAPVHTLYGNGTLKSRPISLAPFSNAEGDLFTIEGSTPRRLVHVALEPPGPVVLPVAAQAGQSASEVLNSDTKATQIGNVRAAFEARVNPEGKASTVHFEYVDDAGFQESGFATAKRAPVSAGEDPAIAPDAAKYIAHEASVQIACPDPNVELAEGKCLKASTLYHFRAVASNSDAPGARLGPEASFETLPPIDPGPSWATGVGADTARLHGQLNPAGLAAHARFEYVDDATYQESGFEHATKTGEFDFGAGNAPVARSAQVYPLAPHTTYHYRYLAHDFFGDFPGPEHTLETSPVNPQAKQCPANQAFRSGASANLPDCRAYEMVSPLDKANGDIVALNENNETSLGASRARIDQATPGGDALAYTSQRAFGDALSAPYGSEYIARRTPQGSPGEGWSSHSINPPREGSSLLSGGFITTELLFSGLSENLCSAWFLQDTGLALAEGAPTAVPALYRRRNCGEEGYELLSSVQPPGFGPEAEGNYFPAAKAFTPDGATSVFKAPTILTQKARTVAVGATLSCEIKNPAPTYQWLADGAIIGGATAHEYTTTGAEAGKAIQCQVFAVNTEADKNSGGFAGVTQISNPTLVVAPFPASAPPIAPPAIAAPTASAPPEVGGGGGQALGCDPNAAKWEGVSSFAYQWYRNGAPIASATNPTYTTTAGDLASAAAFQCVVSGIGPEGSKASEASESLLTDPAPDPAPGNPDPRVGDIFRAYLQGPGGLRLVSVLPAGFAAQTHASVGTAQGEAGRRLYDSVQHAVSEDGSRVFWSAEVAGPSIPMHHLGFGTGSSRLYLRLNAEGEETTAKDGEGHCVPDPTLACTIAISSGAALFLDANPQGTKALYSEGEDLYEADIGAGGETVTRTLIADKVKGILGASSDLGRVYAVSEALCSGAKVNSEGEAAQAGAYNLYLYETGEQCGAGEMAFVARLRGGGFDHGGDDLSFAPKPINHSSRVSGSGLHAAFMSRAPLTGYDNTDAQSGEADSEVYLYDAGQNKLLCASCNPSGGRPEGRDLSAVGQNVWAAARIPGWETQFQPSRPLSEDGTQLFFESFEALVSRDTNGHQDVYEWERAATEKECTEQIGGERFIASQEGCLSLISSGKGGGDAEFLDASADGSDVFFTTAASLVPADPGLIDVYDAREGGGFPAPAAPAPSCEGEACQSPPAAPNDPTPASSSFQGPGNVHEAPAKPKCKKGKVRRHGKCVKKHRNHKRTHHRISSNRRSAR
jgi:hypothetical protein